MMQSTKLGTPVKQFSVFLENRVGAFAELVKLLNEAYVHILGVSTQEAVDVTVLRLIVSDPDAVEETLKERRLGYSTCHVLVVELPEGAAGLTKCLTSLLMAETNINFCYPLLSRPHGQTALALHLDDTEFARTVLHNNGFKLLMQEDISR